jgi:hypothetical protein
MPKQIDGVFSIDAARLGQGEDVSRCSHDTDNHRVAKQFVYRSKIGALAHKL